MAFQGNHVEFNQRLNAFLAARPSPGGLPTDYLIRAHKGYLRKNIAWSDLIQKGNDFESFLKKEMPDVVIFKVVAKSVGHAKPAIGISVLHLNAKPLETSEAFFGAYHDIFVFKRTGFWHVKVNDAVVYSGHLHRRLITRSDQTFTYFAVLHNRLSLFWPALVEVGNLRRRRAQAANVGIFMMPAGDALAFGEMQLIDEHVPEYAPRLWDARRERIIEHILYDALSVGDRRIFVQLRTVFGLSRLNRCQKELLEALNSFVERRMPALLSLRGRYLFAKDAREPYGDELSRIFATPNVSHADISDAIEELDRITSSSMWNAEQARSRGASTERSPTEAG